MKLSPSDIMLMLTQLGIEHNSTPNHNGWVDIICPLPGHNDTEFGNAGINVNSGMINCFKCHGHKYIGELYKETFNEYFNENSCGMTDKEIQNTIQTSQIKKLNTDTVVAESFRTVDDYPFTHISLTPKVKSYLYTSQRGISKKFCETFNVKHCISNPYNDFFIIPIVDKAKDIYEFEARKLKEYEILCKFFNDNTCYRDYDCDYAYDNYKILKEKFNKYKNENRLKYRKGKIIQKPVKEGDQEKEIFNDTLCYLMTPKVKYIFNSRCHETIWNIDNLDFTKPLYIVEGCGSLSIIYTLLSNNVTTLFGSNCSNAQLKYLKKFNKIIIIPDPDMAGTQFVVQLASFGLKNLYVKDIGIEDTDSNYIDRLKLIEEIHVSEFLTQNLFHLFCG